MNDRSRKGSALLIVLGMVAFMVVSAVAFSVYMRSSRLPSSFLRREVLSRMLVKSALANAIDEIDRAIGNNPHPGIGYLTSTYLNPGAATKTTFCRNCWRGRVYIGTGPSGSGEAFSLSVPQMDTVSPLCLEALAYIPPPLVNEARYYSRHSTAAQWHQLPFDAGRYAFCAIDVSDYFDLNALKADTPRSSATDSRISLSYLFENDEHTSADGWVCTASEWDNTIKGLVTDDSNKLPFVSIADWNLALYDKNSGLGFNPFCEYVTGQNGNLFYSGGREEAYCNKIRRLTFVTDSYLPEDTVAKGKLLENNQPFGSSFPENKNIVELIKDTKLPTPYDRCFGGIGAAMLYDYLDADSVPVSLSIPTCEQVPMICGIKPELTGLKLAITANYITGAAGAPVMTSSTTSTREWELEKEYLLSFDQVTPSVSATVVYPFRHGEGSESYTLKGRVQLYLSATAATAENNRDTTSSWGDDVLHYTRNPGLETCELDGNGIVSIPLEAGYATPSSVKTEADAVKSVALAPKNPSDAWGQLSGVRLLKVKYKLSQTPSASGTWTPSESTIEDPQYLSTDPGDYDCKIPALKGVVKDTQFDSANLKTTLDSGRIPLYLNATVCVRLVNKDGKTVDMAPACLAEDAVLNLGTKYNAIYNIIDREFFGGAYPYFRFSSGVEIEFSDTPTVRVDVPTVAPTAIMVGDPRYNHAPESWFPATDISPTAWLSNCHAHDRNRDGDIFMSVSDQEELQSIYEMANLPRVTSFFRDTAWGTGHDHEFYNTPKAYFDGTGFPASFDASAYRDLAWRTYDPFIGRTESPTDVQGIGSKWLADGDDFEGLAEELVANNTGFRINPYADTNILMAAFANTPYNWRMAYPDASEKAKEFNAKSAWNEYSSGCKFKWEDLQDFAMVFHKAMVRYEDLDEAWSHLAAVDEGSSGYTLDVSGDGYRWFKQGDDAPQDVLCGIELGGDKLYNTDKKFLYGYWRECFAVKQQLFLVFVRAEPAMIGGTSVTATPPQLGAKAMAVVWRNPQPTANNDDPHQTRILFYRQFE